MRVSEPQIIIRDNSNSNTSANDAMQVSGAATKRKKHPRQICGYQLPGKSEKCMVGWKVCGKHFNWEGQKEMEFRNEEYALHQAEVSLQKSQEAIRIRMQVQH